jgi:hypothetical protein
MFPKPLSLRPKLPLIPLGPEAVEVGSPGLALEPIELPEIGSLRHNLQVCPVLGHNRSVIQGSTLIIGPLSICSPLRQSRSRELEQAETPVPPGQQVSLEYCRRSLEATRCALYPAESKQEIGRAAGLLLDHAPQHVPRFSQPGGVQQRKCDLS